MRGSAHPCCASYVFVVLAKTCRRPFSRFASTQLESSSFGGSGAPCFSRIRKDLASNPTQHKINPIFLSTQSLTPFITSFPAKCGVILSILGTVFSSFERSAVTCATNAGFSTDTFRPTHAQPALKTSSQHALQSSCG